MAEVVEANGGCPKKVDHQMVDSPTRLDSKRVHLGPYIPLWHKNGLNNVGAVGTPPCLQWGLWSLRGVACTSSLKTPQTSANLLTFLEIAKSIFTFAPVLFTQKKFKPVPKVIQTILKLFLTHIGAFQSGFLPRRLLCEVHRWPMGFLKAQHGPFWAILS